VTAIILHSTEFALMLELDEQEIEYELGMLDIGDVAISERTGVERKGASRDQRGNVVHDFVASIKDGRIFKQCQDLRDNYENPILIIEGVSKLFLDESVDRKSITSTLASVSSKYKINIIPTETLEDTAQVIKMLTEYDGKLGYSKPTNKHPKPKNTSEKQVYLTSTLFNTGFRKSVDLLTHFGCPMEIFKAIEESHYIKPPRGSKKKLISIFTTLKGYGPKFVENNKKLLTNSFNPSDVNVNISETE